MAEPSLSHVPAPAGRTVDKTIGRLVTKMAITTGLIAVGWLVSAALSTSASASDLRDAEPASEHAAAQAAGDSRPASGVFGLLGSSKTAGSDRTGDTVATINSTVASVAKTTEETVGTVTKTTGDTVGTVTKSVDAVTESVTSTVTTTVDRAAGTLGAVTDSVESVPARLAPVTGESGTEAREPVAVSEPAPVAEAAPETAAQPAKPQARQSKPAVVGPRNEPAPAASTALDDAERPAGAPTKSSATAGDTGKNRAPAAPVAPVAPGVAAAQAGADTAAGKSHDATLAATTTETQLRLSGTSNCRSVFGAKSDPALPCASPD